MQLILSTSDDMEHTDMRDELLAVVDVESTGVDPATDRVVEIGAALRLAGGWQRRSSRVNPGVPIPEAASAVHGIFDTSVADKPGFADTWPRVLALVSGRRVLGYNILAYDLPMLAAEARRHGCQELSSSGVLDVMVFVNWHERGAVRKLSVVAERHGVYPVRGAAHSAAVDCQMTGDLLLTFVDKGLVPGTWDLALAEQARIAAVVGDEYRRWGNFIYRDRVTRRLRMGAGKHRGELLTDVPRSYLRYVVEKFSDLAPETVAAFRAAAAGRLGDEFQEQIPDMPVDKPVTRDADGGEVRR